MVTSIIYVEFLKLMCNVVMFCDLFCIVIALLINFVILFRFTTIISKKEVSKLNEIQLISGEGTEADGQVGCGRHGREAGGH